MEFGILGPLEATEDGRPLALGGTKQRSLLAMLVLHANEAVSRERLIDALWDGQPPGSAATALQVYVSQLRKVLDPGATRGGQELLVTRAPGYALQVEPDQLDLRRFERLLGEGRERSLAGRPRRPGRRCRGAGALARRAARRPRHRAVRPAARRLASKSSDWPRSRSESRPTWRSAATPTSLRSSSRSPPRTRCASGCAAS